MPKKVSVCQNVTCRQQGSLAVLAAFEQHAPPDIEIEPSGCLGQCGNGPMALVLPEKTWYHRLRPSDVPAIATQHLKANRLVAHKLYPPVHGEQKSIWIWVISFAIFLGLCILIAVVMGSHIHGYSHG